MKQQCYMAVIYLNWLVLVGGLAYFVITGRYVFALLWLVLVPLAMWLYVREFAKISCQSCNKSRRYFRAVASVWPVPPAAKRRSDCLGREKDGSSAAIFANSG